MNTIMSVPNYYKILGLDPKATESEIRTSYHKLARLYHPDINKGPRYHNLFIKINQAYTVLRNETSRAAYDFELRQQEEANAPRLTYGNFNPASSTSTQAPTHRVEQPTERVTYTKQKVYSSAEFNKHYQAAKKAYDNKSFVEAMNEVNEALSMNGKSFMAHELKGDILMMYANYSDAQNEFLAAQKYDKNNEKLQMKINTCTEKLKPKKRNIFTRLKNKLFEDADN